MLQSRRLSQLPLDHEDIQKTKPPEAQVSSCCWPGGAQRWSVKGKHPYVALIFSPSRRVLWRSCTRLSSRLCLNLRALRLAGTSTVPAASELPLQHDKLRNRITGGRESEDGYENEGDEALKNERLISGYTLRSKPLLAGLDVWISRCTKYFCESVIKPARLGGCWYWSPPPHTHTHTCRFATLITSLCEVAYIWKRGVCRVLTHV